YSLKENNLTNPLKSHRVLLLWHPNSTPKICNLLIFINSKPIRYGIPTQIKGIAEITIPKVECHTLRQL
ncbi:hypothetical protein PSI23_20195, partial [Xenorhabdus sp. XENO-10]